MFKKILTIVPICTLISGLGVSVVSCNNTPRSGLETNQQIADKISNKSYTFEESKFWGILTYVNKQEIITDISKKIGLNNTEKSKLAVDPDILQLEKIGKDKSSETQKLYITVGKGSDQAVAQIYLTWALTSDQIPLYPIYLDWQNIDSRAPYPVLSNVITFDEPTIWDPANPKSVDGWNPQHYSELVLNQDPFKSIIDKDLNGLVNPQISKYLVLPNTTFNVGITQTISNIIIKNNTAQFNLLYHPKPLNETDQLIISQPLQLSYVTDYNFIKNMLPKLPKGRIELSTVLLRKSPDGNYYSSNNSNSGLIQEHIGFVYPKYAAFTDSLNFTGQLKIGDNNIEVYYNNVDQHFTIPITIVNLA